MNAANERRSSRPGAVARRSSPTWSATPSRARRTPSLPVFCNESMWATSSASSLRRAPSVPRRPREDGQALMTGPKTNERPGTRATLRGYHMSRASPRGAEPRAQRRREHAANPGGHHPEPQASSQVLASAVANAVTNDGMNADELYISAAFADEGITMKRFTPRAATGRQDPQALVPHHGDRVAPGRGSPRVLRAQRNAQAAVSRTRRCVVAPSRRPAGEPQQARARRRGGGRAGRHDVVETEMSRTPSSSSSHHPMWSTARFSTPRSKRRPLGDSRGRDGVRRHHGGDELMVRSKPYGFRPHHDGLESRLVQERGYKDLVIETGRSATTSPSSSRALR